MIIIGTCTWNYCCQIVRHEKGWQHVDDDDLFTFKRAGGSNGQGKKKTSLLVSGKCHCIACFTSHRKPWTAFCYHCQIAYFRLSHAVASDGVGLLGQAALGIAPTPCHKHAYDKESQPRDKYTQSIVPSVPIAPRYSSQSRTATTQNGEYCEQRNKLAVSQAVSRSEQPMEITIGAELPPSRNSHHIRRALRRCSTSCPLQGGDRFAVKCAS